MKIIVYPKCEIAVYTIQVYLLNQGYSWNTDKSRKQIIRRNIRVFELNEKYKVMFGMGNSRYSKKAHIPRKKRH